MIDRERKRLVVLTSIVDVTKTVALYMYALYVACTASVLSIHTVMNMFTFLSSSTSNCMNASTYYSKRLLTQLSVVEWFVLYMYVYICYSLEREARKAFFVSVL
jgi:hypothetical protein